MPARRRAVRPLSPRVESLENRLTPATFTVNSVLDTIANDNLVTLREAITTANGTAEADTILFQLPAESKIVLGGTQLPIVTKDLTITGTGPINLLIDGDNASRVLQIAAGATVSLTDLSIGNSKIADTESGGAILNSGTLTVDRVIVVTNFAGTGAGIFNDGTLTFNSSAISVGFASKNGGGIANAGTLFVNNSTFSSNFAEGDGGGISNTGTATVRNATFVANNADSEGKNANAEGGAVFNNGTFTLLNSIAAGNLRGTAGAPDDISGNNLAAASIGNVIGSSAAAGGLQDGDQNVVGVDGKGVRDVATILNPVLDDNGGGTATHALVAGSVAIDQGVAGAGGFAFDQRGPGFPRTFGAGVDAGAFELQSAAVLVVDTTSDADDGDFSAGQLSLREALRLNNTPNAGVTTITFAQSLNGKIITLGGTALPTVTDGVAITGPGAKLLTIDGNDQSRILEIAANVTASISGLTLTGGKVLQDAGGAIENSGTLTLNKTVLTGNSAEQVAALGGFAGAIFNFGTLTITDSTLSNNKASFDGGAIDSQGTLTITNSTFSGNTGGIDGGAIRTVGTTTITHSTIVLNRGGSGGGININGGKATLFNSIVAGNTRGDGTTPDDISGFGTADAESVGNVIGDAATAGGLTNAPGINVVGAALASVVNVLADNGGPTQTHALVAGSPAIGLGFDNKSLDADGKTLTADQRGLPRPVVSLDAGAFELQFVTIAPATLPAGVLGTAFTQTLTATGGTGPFTFAVTGPLTGTLPPGLTLSADGVLSGTPTATGTFDFVVTATAASGDFGTQAFSVAVGQNGGVVVRTVLFEVGGDVGSGTVRVFNANGTERFTLTPFGADFTGGVRVATGDLNGDGVDDLVVGTGPGVATRVIAFDGVTQQQLTTIDPFEPTFLGGVFVAVGDIDGDGVGDILISPDQGGGPRVRIFSGKGSAQIDDFFGIDDPNFRGGARTATGDVNGDGRADVLVAAGFKGGPRVAVFDGKAIGSTRVKLFNDFFIFEDTLRNGAFIASGDVDGDGFAEVIGGGGPGGGPRVFALSGKDLLTNTQVPVANFFAGDETNRGGIRIVAKDIDGDAFADILAGDGTGAGSRVTTFLGKDIDPNGTPPSEAPLTAFEGFTNGVFVG